MLFSRLRAPKRQGGPFDSRSSKGAHLADSICPKPNRPAPTPDEAAALALAAIYLKRPGTQASNRLLSLSNVQGNGQLLLALRDTLLSAGALCADLAEQRQ